ncbi:MAG: HlyD family efflux transporter periplasmic adaptor subunit [Spirochaetaceae bacterium]|jgi:multidrug efflux pump subunit AcrA (membrane-fusion protein)|nr:HlyD family efflux transporter periplasmic adaptor subunit [Spirochaetaceae bacterium]
MSKRKKSTLVLVSIVIAIVSLGLFAAFRSFEDNGKNASLTYKVKSETYTSTIEIAGTISAAKEQNLQAAGDGTVNAVFVKEGDTVTRGQIILQMDDSEQRYNLAKHDYEMEQTQMNGSRRQLQLMATQRVVLLQRIKDRQIAANFDGVIAEFSASAGDVLEAKDVAGVIVDRSYLTATVEVVETDAPKLKIGQNVTLAFPANENKPIEGRVYSFPTVAAKSSRGASVVKAEIRVDDPPDIILPNYSFTGTIEISPPETLLLVERQAIGYNAPAGGAPGAPPTGRWGERGTAPGEAPPTGAPPEGGASERKRGGAASGERGTASDSAPPEGGAGERKRGGAFVERILADGTKERVVVQIARYGDDFVKVLSGLAEGDVLAAQEAPRPSGWNKSQTQSRSEKTSDRQEKTNSVLPGMPSMPTMGGGPGGGRGGPPR